MKINNTIFLNTQNIINISPLLNKNLHTVTVFFNINMNIFIYVNFLYIFLFYTHIEKHFDLLFLYFLNKKNNSTYIYIYN